MSGVIDDNSTCLTANGWLLVFPSPDFVPAQIRPGDTVTFGGGFSHSEPNPNFILVPTECSGYSNVFFINPGHSATLNGQLLPPFPPFLAPSSSNPLEAPELDESGVAFPLAIKWYDDRQLLFELINDADHPIALGEDADIWVENNGTLQFINIRTTDKDLIRKAISLPVSEFSTVVGHHEPPTGNTILDPNADSIALLIQTIVPDVQGMSVRTSDGVLVVLTLYTSKLPPNLDLRVIQILNDSGGIEFQPLRSR